MASTKPSTRVIQGSTPSTTIPMFEWTIPMFEWTCPYASSFYLFIYYFSNGKFFFSIGVTEEISDVTIEESVGVKGWVSDVLGRLVTSWEG